MAFNAGQAKESESAGAGIRTVQLPGQRGRTTTQLGFGCAYFLSGNLDEAKSLRLLDAAWNAGVRHFDVARSYGQGKTEELLGRFLRLHPDATVTTKFGLEPQSFADRTLAALQRRVPGMRNLPFKPSGSTAASFTGAEATRSLDRSLRLLGRDFIDIFLLHEAEASLLVHDDLVDALEEAKRQGKIGEYGIGGEDFHLPGLLANRRPYCRVLQFEWSLLAPPLDTADAYRIHYRVFAKATQALGKRFEQQPELARQWSDETGMDLREPGAVSRLLLKAALDAWPANPALFSTGHESHILDNVAAATDESLAEPASRLASLMIASKT